MFNDGRDENLIFSIFSHFLLNLIFLRLHLYVYFCIKLVWVRTSEDTFSIEFELVFVHKGHFE